MESSSALSRFLFRDHRESENSEQSDTSLDGSSVSSDQDDELGIKSMAGKGIKHLCSELLEIQEASDEDFQRNIFSNYSNFVRILEEVEDVENELMKLKHHILTQKNLLKELRDGLYLDVLSEEMIELIIEEPVCTGQRQQNELEIHINDVSDALDLLLSESKVDEALSIIEVEDENLQRLQFEGNTPSDVLMLYNSLICERKAMFTLQLTLIAKNPRTAAPELQNTLVGLCRLGESHLASQLLLEYYHSRIATGIHSLWSSKSDLQETYIRDLARFVFSVISQAARSFVMLYGEDSPYASELIQWACEETEVFVVFFNKHVKSISEVSGGLSKAVESVQLAISFCSLSETQLLVLQQHLIKHIYPGMEVVLQVHIDHYKKVVGMFTATESWVLGRYLVSGVLYEAYSSIVVGNQPEYCLLTTSGRKFATLLQAICGDTSPLIAFQMRSSILGGLMNLFMEYIIILERAITCEEVVTEKGGSRINLAESLVQQVSVLVNVSTLEHFFSSIVRTICGDISHTNSEPMRKHLAGGEQEELDSCMFLIQEASGQLRARFCQQFVHRMMFKRTGFNNIVETCNDDQQDLMPSIAFQVLFIEVRKLEKLAEDGIFELNWLVELLRELIEAIFVSISNNKEFWAISEENLTAEPSDDFKKEQFVLDMQFLVEIANYGEYFSGNPSELVASIKSAFLSAGLDPERDITDSESAINAASEAIIKLLEIEKGVSFPNDKLICLVEEKSHGNQSGYVSDSLKDDSGSHSEASMEPGEDIGDVTESVTAETTEVSLHVRLLDLLEQDDDSVYSSAVNSTENSIEIEDIDSKKAANAVHEGYEFIEKTELPATLSVDKGGENYKVQVCIEEGASHQVPESAANKLEDAELGFSWTEDAPANNFVKVGGEDEKDDVNLTDSVLMADSVNSHFATSNAFFKDEDPDIKETESM